MTYKNTKLKLLSLVLSLALVLSGVSSVAFAESEQIADDVQSFNIVSEGLEDNVSSSGAAGEVMDTYSLSVAATEPSWRLAGLQNGDILISGESIGRRVTIVDDSEERLTIDGVGVKFTKPTDVATGVSKVVFYVDDIAVLSDSESPFEYTIETNIDGSHTLKAEIYDDSSNLADTITKSFSIKKGYQALDWKENFDGTNPVIPENTISYYTNPDGSYNIETSHLAGKAPWEQSVKSCATLNDSKAWYLYTGQYSSAYPKGTTTKLSGAGFNFALWPESLDVSNDINRVFFEFDYVVEYWAANQSGKIYLKDGFKNDKQKSTYGIITMPGTDILSNGKNKAAKHTKVSCDLSWNVETRAVSYKLYLNDIEYIRYSYTAPKAVDPELLTPHFCAAFNEKLPFFIDNIRVATYDTQVIDAEPEIALYKSNGEQITNTSSFSPYDASYLTIDLPGGIDTSTLNGNVSLIDTATGNTCQLNFDGNKAYIQDRLYLGTSYKLTVGKGIRNLEGLRPISDSTQYLTTALPQLHADRSATGFLTSELPPVDSSGQVSFNAKIAGSAFSGKPVDVVVAVYEGNTMVNLVVSTQTVPATGILTPVNITIAEMKQNTVVEAFIVDNISGNAATMNSVTEQIYILK